MKKWTTLFLFTLSLVCYSQTKEVNKSSKDSTCFKDFKVNTTIGFGTQILDLKINDLLQSQGLATMETVLPEFSIGINYFGKKVSVDTELGILYDNPDRNGNENKYVSYAVRGRVHYNLINKFKFAFTTGLNLTFSGNQLDIYSQNNTIDLNTLNPIYNAGHVSLKNHLFYVGPSVAVYLFKSSSFPIRVNAGYELALSRGRWNSDFANVVNSVNERGNNRFLFGLTFL